MDYKRFDNYIENLQSELVIWPAYYLEQDKNYKMILDLDKKSKIVEFGPGRGYFTDWLVCNGYTNITLVEIDQVNCNFLSQKYSKFENIKVVTGDMVSFLKYTKEKYDLIISKQVIEHIQVNDISSVFKNGDRVLNKNGLMIHETINASNLIYGNYYRYIDFSHTTSFTVKSMKEFAGDLSILVENHNHAGLIELIKSHIDKKIKRKILLLKEQLVFNNKADENSLSVNLKSNFFKKIINLIKSFWLQIVIRIRRKISYFFSRLFLPKTGNVFTPFLIVVYKKL